jgi:imidazolonepropionase-like amidohydrolase
MEEVWWKKYTDEELRAMTDEAHGVGKLVAVHAHTDEAVQQALRCGVDTIEHGVFITPETADTMATRRTPLVPTLAVKSGRAIERAKAAGAVSPHQLKKRAALVAVRGDAVKLAYERGVLLATGTDAYFTLRGDYWGLNGEEVQLFIEAGVAPRDALAAATAGAAAAVGLADKIGAIAEERSADLVAYTRSPIEDPSCLTDPDAVAVVVKDGEVVAGSFAGLQDVLAQLGAARGAQVALNA